jgi:hypothetical protein
LSMSTSLRGASASHARTSCCATATPASECSCGRR